MESYNQASKSDLLNIMCEFADFPKEQDFLIFSMKYAMNTVMDEIFQRISFLIPPEINFTSG